MLLDTGTNTVLFLSVSVVSSDGPLFYLLPSQVYVIRLITGDHIGRIHEIQDLTLT